VHEAVSSGTVLTAAAGGMKFSLMTGQEHVTPEEKYKLRFILPEYFGSAEKPAAK
jgi:hypothetical protein